MECFHSCAKMKRNHRSCIHYVDIQKTFSCDFERETRQWRIFQAVLFFTSITKRKEKQNQHKENVNFNLIDCCLNYLNSFSPDKEVRFWLELLNCTNTELRRPQAELLYWFLRKIAETSNANIIWNADYLLAMKNKDNSGIVSVGTTKKGLDTTKLNLTY